MTWDGIQIRPTGTGAWLLIDCPHPIRKLQATCWLRLSVESGSFFRNLHACTEFDA